MSLENTVAGHPALSIVKFLAQPSDSSLTCAWSHIVELPRLTAKPTQALCTQIAKNIPIVIATMDRVQPLNWCASNDGLLII